MLNFFLIRPKTIIPQIATKFNLFHLLRLPPTFVQQNKKKKQGFKLQLYFMKSRCYQKNKLS
jgi:hypothetical protein